MALTIDLVKIAVKRDFSSIHRLSDGTRPLSALATSCSYAPPMEQFIGMPVEVEVRDSLEKAMKILKQKLSKEGILQELKRRRFYEKPSVKKKRKMREARKRLRREMKRRVTPQTPR